MRQIYTHDGGAHLDEICACSVQMALYPNDAFVIHRVSAVNEYDPDSFYIDISSPDWKLDLPNVFDHHFEPDNNPENKTALSKVLAAAGLLDTYSDMEWFIMQNIRDNRGPAAASSQLGHPGDAFKYYSSPIVTAFTFMFGQAHDILPSDVLMPFLTEIGVGILRMADKLTTDDLRSMFVLQPFKEDCDDQHKLTLIMMDTVVQPGKINKYAKEQGWDRFLTLSRSDRAGEVGWKLWRSDACGFDLKPKPGFVNYAHHSGFLAVIKNDFALDSLVEYIADCANLKVIGDATPKNMKTGNPVPNSPNVSESLDKTGRSAWYE